MEEEKIPKVPKYQAENTAMHLGRANRNLAIAVVCICVVFCIAITLIVHKFVDQYTSRTDKWLETYARLTNSPSITEVTDGHKADP